MTARPVPAFLALVGGGFGSGQALANVGTVGTYVVYQSQGLILGSVLIPIAQAIYSSSSSGGLQSGGPEPSVRSGSSNIEVKDSHVNVPNKHNLGRLASSWSEQKRILIDAVPRCASLGIRSAQWGDPQMGMGFSSKEV